jgi:hypothetical protein
MNRQRQLQQQNNNRMNNNNRANDMMVGRQPYQNQGGHNQNPNYYNKNKQEARIRIEEPITTNTTSQNFQLNMSSNSRLESLIPGNRGNNESTNNEFLQNKRGNDPLENNNPNKKPRQD